MRTQTRDILILSPIDRFSFVRPVDGQQANEKFALSIDPGIAVQSYFVLRAVLMQYVKHTIPGTWYYLMVLIGVFMTAVTRMILLITQLCEYDTIIYGRKCEDCWYTKMETKRTLHFRPEYVV